MAQTMSMGQAAGMSAILSLDSDCSASEPDIVKLQENLVRTGSVLDIPERIADTGRHGWKNNFI
jgi:hypothetical protein